MKILVGSHGHMASGMKTSIEILSGKQDNLETYDAYVENEEGNIAEAVENFLQKHPKEETKLLVADIYGGSVCQQMMRFINEDNVYVIAGANLAMLLELVLMCSEQNPEEERILQAIENSKEMTKRVILENRAASSDAFF